MYCYVVHCRAVILGAEQTQYWTIQVRSVVDGSNRPLGCKLVSRHHDTPSPAVDDGIKSGYAARHQHRVPAARASTENPDLPVYIG